MMMTKKQISVAAVLWVLAAASNNVSGEILQLTAENYHEMVEGKSIFISFVSSSSCGEVCDAMQETWSRLSDDWKDHDIGLVAQVDCTDYDDETGEASTVSLNPICEEYGIETFPNVIYGDPTSPELYPYTNREDLTNYQTLSAFCQATIAQPTCRFDRLSHCPEAQRVVLQDLLTKTREELEAMETQVDEQLLEQEVLFDQGLQKINDEYQKLVHDHNAKIETIRQETHYKWLQQVLGDMDHKEAEQRQQEILDELEDDEEEGEDEL